ncbi:hypothetical protein QBA35_32945 [Streptomyces bottropensis]|uniref:Uncharacterized protein n=1 Tax=Streptomyces bottropensis TaxID=42235 RepID=A0ABU8AWP5_9ACTN
MAEVGARWLPPPGDVASAAVVLVAMVAVGLGAGSDTDASPAVTVALGAVIAGSLAFRRRAPPAGFVVGTAGLAVEALWAGPGPLTPVANLIGVHAPGLYASPRRAALGALLVPPGVLAYFAPKEDPAVVPVAVVEGRLPDGGHVGAALTNALRHGHARSAEVTVRRQRWGNTVLVRGVDGRGPRPWYRPGRGPRGIGERAAAHGGSMAHGPVGDGGGFALSVELPLP